MMPVSDQKKMSLTPHTDQTVTRSHSETSYTGLASMMGGDKRCRRPSDWSARTSEDKQVVLRPLQLNGMDEKDFGSLLYRRLSKATATRSPTIRSTESSPKDVSRSYSMKTVKKFAEARHRHRGSSIPSEATTTGGVRVKERTISNRSLPLPGDESEYLRLRNFSVTSKGVINRGDSFRSKSSSHVPGVLPGNSDSLSASGPAIANPSPLREDSKESSEEKTCDLYKVLLIGAAAVGKTSMKNQFMTSEYICAYDFSHDQDIDKTVAVVLNNEESQMEFEEETILEEKEHPIKSGTSEPDAYLVVYSVTNRRSYLQARHLLSQIEGYMDSKAVILVGNKTDLARLRVVTTEEGKSLAKERGCKFIETSVAINHQVDELLVGTLTQIRMKAKAADKLKKKRESQDLSRKSSMYSGSKASSVLKRILKRACLKSKSCDNLHVL